MITAQPILWITNGSEFSENQLASMGNLGEVVQWKLSEVFTGTVKKSALQRVTALVVGLGFPISRNLIDQLPHLRIIASPTTGLDHIDCEYATARKIQIISLQEHRTQIKSVTSTAELAWLLILGLSRRLPSVAAHVSLGSWNRVELMGTQLSGCTIGIVGFGRLGSQVASYAQAFGMRILAYDSAFTGVAQGLEHVNFVDSSYLLAESDVVTIHLPLTNETRGWLSEDRIASMKLNCILVNTSRGGIIDEHSACEALKEGKLGGLGLDVLDGDSSWTDVIPSNHPVNQLIHRGANILITPHIGGYTREAVRFTRDLIIKDLTQFWRLLNCDVSSPKKT